MDNQAFPLSDIFQHAWLNFRANLPAILLALFIFLIGIFFIRYLRNLAERIMTRRAHDMLVVSFLTNIFSFVLVISLVVICLSILGWGSITNKILAGAGITSFVIGFALKDIGENFLAGILMAFRRPFRMGDLIEVSGIKGQVRRMTLRETTVKTHDGRDAYIPNGMIVKNPLENLTIDNLMRSDFVLMLDVNDDIDKTLQDIEAIVQTFERVEKTPPPQAIVEEIVDKKAKVSIRFWYKTDEVKAPGSKLRSSVIIKVAKALAKQKADVSEKLA